MAGDARYRKGQEATIMYFLAQFTYKDTQIKALVAKPQDRTAMLRQAVESFGGKLHHFFFAYGDYDAVMLMEFPDLESASAGVMTIIAGGGASSFRTTVLIEPEQAMRAMSRAGSGQSGYAPPDRRFAAFSDPERAPVEEGSCYGLVRPAGSENMRDKPRRPWDRIDQASDESFPASDPPSASPGAT
jgi:uncharacterized protein with GYD domain